MYLYTAAAAAAAALRPMWITVQDLTRRSLFGVAWAVLTLKPLKLSHLNSISFFTVLCLVEMMTSLYKVYRCTLWNLVFWTGLERSDWSKSFVSIPNPTLSLNPAVPPGDAPAAAPPPALHGLWAKDNEAGT